VSGPTISYTVSFRRQRESRLTAPPSPPFVPLAQLDAPARPMPAATPIACQLALAHLVERLIDAGELKDYAEAARRLGMAKSHMTHVTNLLSLAPDIQEAILAGQLATTEHALRSVCCLVTWQAQRDSLTAVLG